MERTGDASRDLGRGGSALVLDSNKIITKVSVPRFFKKNVFNSNSSTCVFCFVGGGWCVPASPFLPGGVTGRSLRGNVCVNV